MDKKIIITLSAILVFGIIYYETANINKRTITPQINGSTNTSASSTNNQAAQTTENPQISPISNGLSLNITNPQNNSTVGNSKITIIGKTSPGAEVFINETEVKADSDGNFSGSAILDEGRNTLVITANDENGNYAENDLTVNLESTL
jgi:hypothetical protein